MRIRRIVLNCKNEEKSYDKSSTEKHKTTVGASGGLEGSWQHMD